ncbi:uncharacterized protein LOC116806475 isoform X2 [Drosophila grimshawi]|uniref:uncharacterized protein LOC116806475 isoform X2 n=1 Tax=Drosophila grimshawi TaxID=7222 RepID=UPI000C86ED24|nr:uncharacterized protein LOC116806475 isoform X2 [Drosophila grimshawi]
MRRLLPLILGVAFGILGSRAVCRTCGSVSDVACISETQFQFCMNNQLVAPVYSCPTGSYCTNQISICQKNETLKACGSCGQCDNQHRFACTGVRSFALCLGTNTSSNCTGICDLGYVCNRDLHYICGNAQTTIPTCTVAPTITTTTATTTTTTTSTASTTISLDNFCRISFHGVSIHAIPNDTQCTRYYIQSWVGRIVDCPPTEPYFDGTTLSCGNSRPTQPGCR